MRRALLNLAVSLAISLALWAAVIWLLWTVFQ